MILVAGGTGRLGSLLVERLTRQGRAVRVLTREPGRVLHPGATVEVAVGDLRDRASLLEPMRGVTTVVAAAHGFGGPGRVTPTAVDNHGNVNLVDVAAAAGADVVMMSVIGAAPNHPMELFRAKHAAETHLRASGTPWTIVRAAAFAELWAELVGRGIVFGRGDNPINFVSVVDVAAALEHAVVDPTVRGDIIEMAGAENLTMNEFAELLQHVRSKPRTVHHVPRWFLRAAATVARPARAAVAMDVIDMTFERQGSPVGTPVAPPTPLAEALAL